MSDYLYIDTANARAAASHLRTMWSTGADSAAEIRRASALADLTDTVSHRLDTVATALNELAGVLDERSDAADAGGLLPYRASSASLAAITESLYDYTSPTTGEIFPPIGQTTTRPEAVPLVDEQCSPEDPRAMPEEHSGWRTLLDPLLPKVVPPVVPLGLWDSAKDGTEKAWEIVEAGGQEVEEIWSAIDWSAAERFQTRLHDTVANPLIVATTMFGAPTLGLETASYYGIISAGYAGFALSYTRAGDGERHLGLTIPVALPSPTELLMPFATFSPTSSVPENGVGLSALACDVVCVGATVNEDGSAAPVIGVGPPGVSGGPIYTEWHDIDLPGWGDVWPGEND